MKQLSLLFLLTIFSLGFSQQTDWHSMGLKGKMKTLERSSFNISDKQGKIDTTNLDTDVYYFNEFGFFDSIIKLSNGVVTSREVYTCDNKGLPISSSIVTKLSTFDLRSERKFNYSDKYDSLHIYCFDDKNDTAFFYLLCFDQFTNLIEYTTIMPGFVESERDFYNESNQLIRSEYWVDSTLVTQQKFEYEKGNFRNSILTNFEIDQDYLVIEEFDKVGNTILNIRKKGTAIVANKTWEYRYDKIGNYTERKIYEDSKLIYITNRKFEYY